MMAYCWIGTLWHSQQKQIQMIYLHIRKAMKRPDAEGFMDAMTKEVLTLESMGAWEIVD